MEETLRFSPARTVLHAGLRQARPLLLAALGIFSLADASAQSRLLLARPQAATRVSLPAPAATRVAPAMPTRAARRGEALVASTATGGNWSAPATWVGGVMPAATDDVTIAPGATVTLDVNASCTSLTVEATASLLTSATTSYQLQVAGNVTNNGTLDLSSAAAIGSDLRFTGAGSATFGGTGTTDLQTMSLAKAVRADVVEMTLPTLSVKGSTTNGDGFLLTRTTGTTPADDMTGTLKLSGNGTISSAVVGGSTNGYIIPATGGLWLNNANFTVMGRNGSPTVNGLLRLTTGTFNVGTGIGNSLGFGLGAVYTQEGGTLTSVGRFNNGGNPITFTLSGGTINVMTIGSTSANSSFGLSLGTGVAASAVVVNISGGTINLVNRNGATPNPGLDYNVGGTAAITGGTLNVGTAATATNFNFRIAGNTPSIVVDNAGTPKTVTLGGTTFNYGTLLVSTGTTFDVGAATLVQVGAGITNNGTLTANTQPVPASGTTLAIPGSRLYFLGGVPQTLGGTGTYTSPIRQITFDNSGGGVTLSAPIVATSVAVFTGNVNGAGNLTVGAGNAVFNSIQYGVTGATVSAGNFDVAPLFNLGTGALQLIYAPEITARTTGFEIPATRIVDVVSIANPAGVILAGGNLAIPGVSNASLILTNGVLTTSAANTPVLGASAGAFPTGSTTSYVRGPLGITVNSATAVNRTFAVGDAAGWRPVVVTGITAATDQTFTATIVSGATGGTGVSPVTGLNPTRYVRFENSANLPASARVQLSYGADDVLGNAASASVAQAATAAGAYTSLGGAAATAPATGIVSTLDLTPGNDFFVLANTEGGVLASSVATVCSGTNSGTLTLTGSVGTITGYEANTGSGFAAVAGTNTGTTLAFSNLTATTTFRAVILTADNRTVYSNTATVTVEAAPAATLTAATATTFCGSGTLTLNATAVAGATYQFLLDGQPISGATSATYTTTATTSGSYVVVVTSALGCTATSTAVAVTVNPATTATFSYASATLCVSGSSATPTITGTAGGAFSSTTGLTLDATTGAINPATSTPGTYTVTYSVSGTCPSSATASVTITTAPAATFSYAAASLCASQTATATPVFGAGASAGVFSSTTGLSLDAATGAITPSTSTPGTYTVTNNIAAAGGCAAATATFSVTITAAPVASFSYASAAYCVGATGTATPVLAAGATAGTFSASGTGLSLNATTGVITLSSSTAGTYVVTNTIAASNGCTAATATFSVTINARPVQPTVVPTYNGATTTLTSSSATGNQWYLNGVAIAGATNQTYVVNSAAQFGTYTVVVTNAATGCSSVPSTTLIVSSSVKPLAGSSLSVYPNPTTDGNVTVELSGYAKATELRVYNALGQQVLERTLTGKPGVQTATLDLRQLPAGVYVLRARTEGGLDVRRITKQ